MKKFFTQLIFGLRWRLWLLVLLACAPLAWLTLHNAGDERRQQLADWKQHSLKLVQLAQRQEDEMIGETRQLLRTLAESPQVQSGNRRSCKKLVDELFGSHPRYANLGVIKTNGDFLTSAVAPARPANQAGREYFHRVLESRDFTIGSFPVGHKFGKPTISFGCPVFDASGQLQAVVFAAVDLDWFQRFESAQLAELPKEATWSEIDRDGRILARYPAPEQWIGRPIPERSLLEACFNQNQGVVEALNSEGIPSFYAFASMQSQFVPGNVVTILGIPRQFLFAGADRSLTRNLVGLAIAAGLTLVLGWFCSNVLILRPVQTLVKSTARLGSGDLNAPMGLPYKGGELGHLTRIFDQMAQAMQQCEMESQRADNKLHNLSRRLVEAQETERRHIARELHDEIGQSLTVAEMNLQSMLQLLTHDALAPRLKESLAMVERVLEQVHDLSLNLRPSMLDDLGLEPALRWYTERQARLAGLRARFHADALEHRLDPLIETECFRVAQEALTNVGRHAKASVVVVKLRKEDDRLHLRVNDNGIGFDVTAVLEQAVRGASLGVLSMEERVALAGGGLEFISNPGEGTEVHAWFPLKWQVSRSWSEVIEDEESQKNYSNRIG